MNKENRETNGKRKRREQKKYKKNSMNSTVLVCVCVCVCVLRGCIQKFPDWPRGARTANGTALCHQVKLYRYFVSQSSEICRHNPLYCFLTSVYCCKHIFRYRLSPETFGYNLLCSVCIFQ
jgi:hypothetical protein